MIYKLKKNAKETYHIKVISNADNTATLYSINLYNEASDTNKTLKNTFNKYSFIEYLKTSNIKGITKIIKEIGE